MLPIKKKLKAGFTLIEMVVVVTILGIVAVIASGFLLTSMVASSKAEITKEVRQNGAYALSVMEGLVINSRSVGCGVSSPGPGISVTDLDGNVTVLACDTANQRIASNAALLTANNVVVSNCSFQCSQETGKPPQVTIKFTVSHKGQDTDLKASEKAVLDFETIVSGHNL